MNDKLGVIKGKLSVLGASLILCGGLQVAPNSAWAHTSCSKGNHWHHGFNRSESWRLSSTKKYRAFDHSRQKEVWRESRKWNIYIYAWTGESWSRTEYNTCYLGDVGGGRSSGSF